MTNETNVIDLQSVLLKKFGQHMAEVRRMIASGEAHPRVAYMFGFLEGVIEGEDLEDPDEFWLTLIVESYDAVTDAESSADPLAVVAAIREKVRARSTTEVTT